MTRLLGDPNGPSEIWLDNRVYHGDFEVRRPLTLRGSGQSVLDGSSTGTVLTIDADRVTIDNLIVRDSGRRHTTEDAGIKATGKGIVLQNLRTEDTLFGIELAICHGCRVEGVHVAGTAGDELRGDAIKVWESHDSIVRNCLVERARDVVIWYSRRVTVEQITRARLPLRHALHVRSRLDGDGQPLHRQ